jgi:hypothetical protein
MRTRGAAEYCSSRVFIMICTVATVVNQHELLPRRASEARVWRARRPAAGTEHCDAGTFVLTTSSAASTRLALP